jgi:hypothetical protein
MGEKSKLLDWPAIRAAFERGASARSLGRKFGVSATAIRNHSRAEKWRGARLAIDPRTIDPRTVLAEIAGDPRAPATARVAACKALLDTEPAKARDEDLRDRVAAKAVELLANGRLN